MNNKLLKSWGNLEVRNTSINNISNNKPSQLDIGNLNSYGDCCLPLQKISTIEKNPLVNNKLRQTIAIVKWKIYNFMIEREDKINQTGENIEYNISIAYWIAILSGIFLYFDEKDELNFKQSSLLQEISKPFTIDSFKSL